MVSTLYGTYMGYIDFDGQRYWDARETKSYEPVPVPLEETSTDAMMSMPVVLPSDTTLREDARALLAGDVEQAQRNKDMMEEMQRNDRKLREAAQKRRDKGGPKLVLPTQSK